MSQRLYFIFGPPAFEIELKNRKLMVWLNYKAGLFCQFNTGNYSFHLGMIELQLLAVLAR